MVTGVTKLVVTPVTHCYPSDFTVLIQVADWLISESNFNYICITMPLTLTSQWVPLNFTLALTLTFI